jgi:hypothetical protein
VHKLWPVHKTLVHDASTRSVALLACAYFYTPNEFYGALAQKAIEHTARHQRPHGSWPHGEAANQRWIDDFYIA